MTERRAHRQSGEPKQRVPLWRLMLVIILMF
jgi:hypothetical protein